MSNIVRHVQVPIISNNLCNRLYGKISSMVKLHISDDMMCAGFEAGGRDACQVRYSCVTVFNFETSLNQLITIGNSQRKKAVHIIQNNIWDLIYFVQINQFEQKPILLFVAFFRNKWTKINILLLFIIITKWNTLLTGHRLSMSLMHGPKEQS